jgi:hypothetical protein
MPPHPPAGAQMAYVLPILLIVVALRMWRGAQARRLRIERLLIGPAIYAVIIGLSFYGRPIDLSPLSLGLMALGLAAGLGLGWMRARGTRVAIDPETHELTSQVSPWGMLLLVAIMLARIGIEYLDATMGSSWPISPAAIANALLLLALGNIVGRAGEVWMRAQKLLTEARAAKAAGQAVPATMTDDAH